jgi:hypothetical protein
MRYNTCNQLVIGSATQLTPGCGDEMNINPFML